ncbi:MAG: ATPase domain-containing protein [Candidatus Aenigmatarchaeota archaeon]
MTKKEKKKHDFSINNMLNEIARDTARAAKRIGKDISRGEATRLKAKKLADKKTIKAAKLKEKKLRLNEKRLTKLDVKKAAKIKAEKTAKLKNVKVTKPTGDAKKAEKEASAPEKIKKKVAALKATTATSKMDAKELMRLKTDEKIKTKRLTDAKGKVKGEKVKEEKVKGSKISEFHVPTADEIKKRIEERISGKGAVDEHTKEEVLSTREDIDNTIGKLGAKPTKGYIKTGIPGFDELLEDGIPKGSAILIAGGAGTGKTIFCLQTLAYACERGEKCIYLSLEENEERLKQHMKDFGWNPDKWIKQKRLIVKRLDPFEISRSVEALLTKAKGELMIEFDSIPGMIPSGFKPDRIILDSLTAVASAFAGKEDSYRIYIEQFFRLLEKIGANTFLITETEQIPTIFSKTGDEEFLADGVIVLYNIRKESVRINAIEVLKLRGAKHQKKLIPFEITAKQGIVAYPNEEIYTNLDK